MPDNIHNDENKSLPPHTFVGGYCYIEYTNTICNDMMQFILFFKKKIFQ